VLEDRGVQNPVVLRSVSTRT